MIAYMTLTEYIWNFQWKVALWACCKHVLLILCWGFNQCVLAMFIAEFGFPDKVWRTLHKCRLRSMNLIQFDCCQCLLSHSQVTLKLHDCKISLPDINVYSLQLSLLFHAQKSDTTQTKPAKKSAPVSKQQSNLFSFFKRK